jgi:hypothetical protein
MKILVAGCSMSSGWGFDLEKQDPQIWPNLVGKKLNAEVINIAQTASSNYDIFLQVLLAQQYDSYDMTLVQWTGLDRITLSSGLDSLIILNNIDPANQSPIFQHVSPADLRTFSRVMTVINNMWKAFVDLSRMTQILSQNSTYFINGNLPWTTDFFYNPGYDTFTNFLLAIDTDHKLVRGQIDQIKQNLLSDRWVNLPQGWQYSKLDSVSDTDIHAGPDSHQFYAQQVINFLKEKQCQI